MYSSSSDINCISMQDVSKNMAVQPWKVFPTIKHQFTDMLPKCTDPSMVSVFLICYEWELFDNITSQSMSYLFQNTHTSCYVWSYSCYVNSKALILSLTYKFWIYKYLKLKKKIADLVIHNFKTTVYRHEMHVISLDVLRLNIVFLAGMKFAALMFS